VRSFTVRPSADPDFDEVTVTFVRLSRTSVEAIAAKLRAMPDVTAVEEVEE
jgi:putative Mg2+ transporter-C (MgtC) family protein